MDPKLKAEQELDDRVKFVTDYRRFQDPISKRFFSLIVPIVLVIFFVDHFIQNSTIRLFAFIVIAVATILIVRSIRKKII